MEPSCQVLGAPSCPLDEHSTNELCVGSSGHKRAKSKGVKGPAKKSGSHSNARSNTKCIAENELDSETVEYSIFSKLEDVENYIMEQEIMQTTKFILNRMCKGFGKADPDVASQKKQRVKWIASGVKFMGRPFLLIGDKRYDCRHGKDKNVAKKVRYNEKRQSLVSSGEQQRINNVRKCEQLKMDCPAKIQIRDILVYKEFGVEGSKDDGHDLPSLKDPTNADSYVKHNAQRRLRDRTAARIRALLQQGKILTTERQFHVSFPRVEAHKDHEVGQAAGTQQRVDRRVIQHIHKLVSEGVIHMDHMKPRMDEFVAQLFTGKSLPEINNRRYYPLAKDISNHIQKSMASLMSCEQSTDNLQLLYENLRRENPADCLYFQPSVVGQSRLMYLHQTAGQQVLVRRQSTCRCVLDVKYRDKKSSLPMFLMSLDTDTGCQTIATIILEDELDLTEALSKLKNNSPCWSPVEWTVDNIANRISTLQSLFPGSKIRLKDSQTKSARNSRKRSMQNPPDTQPPPETPGETIRKMLTELHQLSYGLPATADTWSLVSSLDIVRQQAKALVEGSASIVTVTSKHDSIDNTAKSQSKSLKRNPMHEVVWEDSQAGKVSREDPNLLPSGSGLGNIIQAIDHISRSQQDLLGDHQYTYMNSTPQLLAPSLVQPHHTHGNVISQHNTATAPTHHLPPSSSHGLLNMTHTSNLSLQVAGMLTDSYQMHGNNSIGSMYGQLPVQHQQRHYLDLNQPDTHNFVQQMAKNSNE